MGLPTCENIGHVHPVRGESCRRSDCRSGAEEEGFPHFGNQLWALSPPVQDDMAPLYGLIF